MREEKNYKIAVLDMNAGVQNQGLDCILAICKSYLQNCGHAYQLDVFDVRQEMVFPDVSYDIYISSGGPGSPLEVGENDWDSKFFHLVEQLLHHNSLSSNKKYIYFICYSFQLAARYFQLGKVCMRRSTSFGVFPVTMVDDGLSEPIFSGLPNPFYALDSRDYQIIEINDHQMDKIGASLLAIEKERPHVPLERAAMAIRFNNEMFGTQFHPEADAETSRKHMSTDEARKMVIDSYGEEKYYSMLTDLEDANKIQLTQSKILPNFLEMAIASLDKEK